MRYDDPSATYDSGLRYDEVTGASRPHQTMKKIRLPIARKNPADPAEFAEGIVEALTGNANVPAPDPTLTVIGDGAQAIRDKITEIAGTEALLDGQRSQLGTLTETLKLNLRKLADHVEDKCDGDVDKLHTTGFAVTGDPVALLEIGQVQNLRLVATSVEGELRARWKKVKGARNYALARALNAEGPWTENVATTTRTDHVFTDLAPGTKYWVRVRAFGTPGFGGASDPACKIAA